MGIFDAAWLYATIRMSAPLAVTAMGELVSQRAGVINIGLEGMMLSGAFAGVYVVTLTGSIPLGILGAVFAGVLLAAIMALLSVQAGGDQIVVGVGVMLLGLGLTAFLFQELTGAGVDLTTTRMRPQPIPLLTDIPLLGRTLFTQTTLIYFCYLTLPLAWFLLFRTRTGVVLRAAGEVPAAVDGNGVNVYLVRWLATLTAGAAAGFGGAVLSLGQVGLFVEHMTSGRGFLVLAAVFFGRWRPALTMAGCLLFGGAYALQLRLQATSHIPLEVFIVLGVVAVLLVARKALRQRGLGASVVAVSTGIGVTWGLVWLHAVEPKAVFPSEFWLMLPFVLSLVVLGGFVGRAEMPKALALPYGRPQ